MDHTESEIHSFIHYWLHNPWAEFWFQISNLLLLFHFHLFCLWNYPNLNSIFSHWELWFVSELLISNTWRYFSTDNIIYALHTYKGLGWGLGRFQVWISMGKKMKKLEKSINLSIYKHRHVRRHKEILLRLLILFTFQFFFVICFLHCLVLWQC